MSDADETRPAETLHFETSDVEANLALEQGLGVGARELAAQRDPGGITTPDEDDADDETLDRDVGVQAADNDDWQGASTSET